MKHNIYETTKAEGRFLKLTEIEYSLGNGTTAKWEACQRKGSNKAVSIIPILDDYATKTRKLVLIKEFRPPVGSYCVGFPAGLVEEGEDVKETAKRELEEETGYMVDVVRDFGYGETSAGLTGELLDTVVAVIDANRKENKVPKQNLQDNEDIEVMSIELNIKAIFEFIDKCRRNDWMMSSRLQNFLIGLTIVV